MCKFSVSNTVFGSDPCPNVYKYVTIDYTCVGGVTIRPTIIAGVKRVVACEHRPLQMTCPAGQRVYVVKAEYGRGDSTTCLVGTLYQTNCLRDVKAAVAASCVNQQTCVVMAETAIAGNVDPCPGTYKYLVVEYRCV
ncbi:Adhesion G protein-coupled receptor L1 [Lamellibrachia satsuma]|nr:Adhesion G protein-coupled receptor L1 [Lamellibrachia satsuma]